MLFLCTGNSCRSQMAEGLLRHVAGDRFEVVSAGTNPAGLNSDAVATMREIGIDISQHQSKGLAGFLDQKFDYVITVCARAQESCPTCPGAGALDHWYFDDPALAQGSADERRAVFRRVRDEIAARLRRFLEEVGRTEDGRHSAED